MRNSKFAKTLAMVLVIAMLLTMSSFAFADADGTAASDEGNKYPIVLVHGLFGWGGTEVANLHYWGGYSSLQQMLNDAGYEVYTPSIGPVASNWDRACELYAYLVGGTVDYGQYHSAQNGHARYGRTFKGVLPELNDADSTLKVHLVGHSMGGETIRMLAQLLENGDPDEMRATTDGSINKLFTGECRHWIESITTLCTPHDGSQYDGKVYNEKEPYVHQFVAALSAATGANINEENLGLDFKLDQWGLVREPGESYESYLHRVENSNLWNSDVKDLSVYDLSPDGAAVLNSYAKAQDDIYYFSIACSDTYRSAVYPHHYLPYSNMNALMIKSSTYMGSYKNYAAGHVTIDESWWENDGIVSVRSAQYPHEGSSDRYNLNYGTENGVITFKDGTEKGVWNYIEKIERTDHLNMVGQTSNTKYLQGKFYELAAMLASIPTENETPDVPESGMPFVDVVKGTYYYEPVEWGYNKGIVSGVDATHFAPDQSCTRAQVVTFLWRAAGKPTPKSVQTPFTDVKAGSFYSEAAAWAYENGIVKGTTETTFSPNATVTRAQFVSFLWRYENCPEASLANPFSDVPSTAYYAQAVLWAAENGVTVGTGNGTFAPNAPCTRAQVVTFLYRDLAK